MVSACDWDGKVLLWADIGNEMERNIQGRMGGQHQMGGEFKCGVSGVLILIACF